MKSQLLRSFVLRMLFFPALALSADPITFQSANGTGLVNQTPIEGGLAVECKRALEAASGVRPATGSELLALSQRMKATQAQNEGSSEIQVKGLSPQKNKELLDYLADNSPESRAHQANELKSPLGPGNPGHLGDHDDMSTTFAEDYTQLGIHVPSLRAVTRRHDIGKEYLNPELDKEIGARVNAKESNPKTQDLKRYVLAHDEHTFTYGLAKEVAEAAQKFGLSEEQTVDLYRQILQSILYHNFGPLHVDPSVPKAEALKILKARYATLTDEDIENVYQAFWIKFYGNGIPKPDGKGYFVTSYANDLGIEPVHGQPKGPIANALAHNDRITLVTDAALNKIPNQNIGRFGFSRKLIFETFEGSDAIGKNSASLIKAQHEELMLATGKNIGIEQFRPTQYGLASCRMATQFGRTLLEMNSDGNYAKYGISATEADHSILFHYSEGGQTKTVKVDGQDLKNPKVYEWNGTEWKEGKRPGPTMAVHQQALAAGLEDSRTPWDLVMDYARASGLGIPSPKQWVAQKKLAK